MVWHPIIVNGCVEWCCISHSQWSSGTHNKSIACPSRLFASLIRISPSFAIQPVREYALSHIEIYVHLCLSWFNFRNIFICNIFSIGVRHIYSQFECIHNCQLMYCSLSDEYRASERASARSPETMRVVGKIWHEDTNPSGYSGVRVIVYGPKTYKGGDERFERNSWSRLPQLTIVSHLMRDIVIFFYRIMYMNKGFQPLNGWNTVFISFDSYIWVIKVDIEHTLHKVCNFIDNFVQYTMLMKYEQIRTQTKIGIIHRAI